MLIDKLLCSDCGKPLWKYKNIGFSVILKCGCSEYPLISDILYLKKDKIGKDAVKHLINGQEEKALIKLLNLRLFLFLPLYLLFISKTIAKFSKFFFKKPLYLLFGFENTIRIMTLFSFDKKWAWYLINRQKIPSYFYSLLATRLVGKKADRVVDIGCGVGQPLPEFKKRVNAGNLIGIDSSLLNLFLARKFFAGNRTLLVCADIEKGIPLQDSSVSIIHANDFFHYLKSKKKFVKESFRVLKSDGNLAILQTLRESQENILAISPEKLKNMLRLQGFKMMNFYSNATLLDFVVNGKSSGSPKSDSKEVLEDCFSYSCLASKKGGVRSLSFKGRNKKINLKDLEVSQEPWLIDELNLKNILENKYFIFISPHLDDAVLSCGTLLTKLQKLKKQVVVFTVFTKAGSRPYSPQAQRFLDVCGYIDAQELFSEREKEDARAMKFFKAKYYHLGFVDAAWRKKNGEHIYRTDKDQFAGKINPEDRDLIDEVTQKISSLIPKGKHMIVFAPLGIGGHADHVIIKEVANNLEKPVIFWEDFPYNRDKNNLKVFFSKHKEYRSLFFLREDGGSEKEEVIRLYKSQMKSLFPEGFISRIPENYYVSRASFVDQNQPAFKNN